MEYNSPGMFLEKNADWIIPQKGDLAPRNFLSSEEIHTIESINWVSYLVSWQNFFKETLNNLCSEFWGEGFEVQILFMTEQEEQINKLSVWVVPVYEKISNPSFD